MRDDAPSDVLFIGRIIGAGGTAVQSVHDSDTTRFAAGLSGSIGDDWIWDVGTQYSENDFFVQAPDALVDRFDAAIRGLGGPGCNPTTSFKHLGASRRSHADIIRTHARWLIKYLGLSKGPPIAMTQFGPVI